jgi:hypothetical protein
VHARGMGAKQLAEDMPRTISTWTNTTLRFLGSTCVMVGFPRTPYPFPLHPPTFLPLCAPTQESLLLALAADVASTPDTNVDQVILACAELEAKVVWCVVWEWAWPGVAGPSV